MTRDRTTEAPSHDIACSLEATDFEARAAEWRALRRYAKHRTFESGRLTAIYSGEPRIRERLTRLIEEESKCCPFLLFEMREEGGGIRLELRYPPEAEAMIGQVIGTG